VAPRHDLVDDVAQPIRHPRHDDGQSQIIRGDRVRVRNLADPIPVQALVPGERRRLMALDRVQERLDLVSGEQVPIPIGDDVTDVRGPERVGGVLPAFGQAMGQLRPHLNVLLQSEPAGIVRLGVEDHRIVRAWLASDRRPERLTQSGEMLGESLARLAGGIPGNTISADDRLPLRVPRITSPLDHQAGVFLPLGRTLRHPLGLRQGGRGTRPGVRTTVPGAPVIARLPLHHTSTVGRDGSSSSRPRAVPARDQPAS
jgi:hypothetical protein